MILLLSYTTSRYPPHNASTGFLYPLINVIDDIYFQILGVLFAVFVVTNAGVIGVPGVIHSGVVPGSVVVGGVGWGGLGGLGLGGLGVGRLGGLAGLGLGVGPWGGLVGSGLEGQWVPEYSEKLYDDGSYRPEHQLGLW